MGKIKPVQTHAIVLFKDGYHGLNLFSRQYEIHAACMPWGTPIGLYATEDEAKAACEIADGGKLMEEWRENNKKLGIVMNEECFTMKLNMPSMALIFAEHAELLKESQIHILSLIEDASWIGDGLLDWCKENRPEWFEAIDKEK